MKIFEMNYPYFAIIGAENKEECMKFYEEIVCDVEDKEDFMDNMKELEKPEAITKIANTVSEETGKPIGNEEAEEQISRCINDNEPTLLALDRALA